MTVSEVQRKNKNRLSPEDRTFRFLLAAVAAVFFVLHLLPAGRSAPSSLYAARDRALNMLPRLRSVEPPPGPARAALAERAMHGRVPSVALISAWLEREAGRWGVSTAAASASFESRVETARRRLEAAPPRHAVLDMGALKQALLSDTAVYNRDAVTLGHLLFNSRVQCHSGSIAVVLAWLAVVGDPPLQGPRPIFVYTDGHQQPGLLAGGSLYVIEATATDAAAVTISLDKAAGARVTDAIYDLAVDLLGEEAPEWLLRRAVLADSSPHSTGSKVAAIPFGGSRFAVGTPSMPPGDLALSSASRPWPPPPRRRPAATLRMSPSVAGLIDGETLQAIMASPQLHELTNDHAVGAPRELAPTACDSVAPRTVASLRRAAARVLDIRAGPRLVGRVEGRCAVVNDPRECAHDQDPICTCLVFERRGDAWILVARGPWPEAGIPATCPSRLRRARRRCVL